MACAYAAGCEPEDFHREAWKWRDGAPAGGAKSGQCFDGAFRPVRDTHRVSRQLFEIGVLLRLLARRIRVDERQDELPVVDLVVSTRGGQPGKEPQL
jgi:hypothetical protein